MSVPAAGYSWSSIPRSAKCCAARDYVPILMTARGKWVTTGEASGWPRCPRCRKPVDESPKDGLCSTCYYYKVLPREEFWAHEKDFLFPYNIGGQRHRESLRNFPKSLAELRTERRKTKRG